MFCRLDTARLSRVGGERCEFSRLVALARTRYERLAPNARWQAASDKPQVPSGLPGALYVRWAHIGPSRASPAGVKFVKCADVPDRGIWLGALCGYRRELAR